ncbi:MAG: hypothetical protein HY905_28205 [Deltaproteobacteria bacterium]|nr:hypothetical protein [Deltaproteobacteria bacterium]
MILGPTEPSGGIRHDVLRTHLPDLLCLLPAWPVHGVLELAPAYWSKTAASEDVQRALATNAFR